MFATYDRSGVKLAFPENWMLEEDSDEDARLNLTISSPNTAFWSLILYSEVLDLQHVTGQAVESLRQEYPDLESSEVEETLGVAALVGADVNFICLDLTVTTRIRAFHRGASTCLVLCQAEDRELAGADPVFRAITQSLIEGDPSGLSHAPPE